MNAISKGNYSIIYLTIIDKIIQIDSKHSQNNDEYFVFQEIIQTILYYFIRDEWIPNRLNLLGHDTTLISNFIN